MNLFDTLTKEEMNIGRKTWLKKDSILFYEQDLCREVIFLLEGEIKIISYDEEGNEDIYNILKKGDMFGNSLLFSSSKRYLGNVIATKRSHIYRLNKEELLSLLSQNKSFLEAYLTMEANDTFEAKKRIKMLSKHPIEQKILYYLNLYPEGIHISISDLASYLFIPRPSLSRSLSILLKEDKIIKKRNFIQLKN